MNERAKRVGKNEDLFRRVNEQIEELNESFALVAQTMTVVCECGDLTCIDQIELSRDDYERVRSDPILFVVRPGHGKPEFESVVEDGAGYVVVAKRAGGPAELAARLDPRGPR